MRYDRLCQNPVCGKPFHTYQVSVKCCSRPCAIAIRPKISLADRFWAKVQKCSHGEFCPFCCWEWIAGHHNGGYGCIGIQPEGGGKSVTYLAHTVAWRLVNNRGIPDGFQINHHCDNRPCCNPWHIYVGTHKQNVFDAERRQRLAKGEARSDLTTADVLSMQEWYRQGYTLRELAQKFSVNESAIFSILTGRSWKHLSAALTSEERHVLVLAHKQAGNRRRKTTILSEDKVREIRRLAQKGVQDSVLAPQFGVHPVTIKNVVLRKTWKNIH